MTPPTYIMHEDKREQLRQVTQKAYHAYYSCINASQPILDIYNTLLEEYEKISPIIITYESPVIQNALAMYSNILLVTNHLPTPHLVDIRDERFLEELGLYPNMRIHEWYDPNEFRYYPLVKVLAATHTHHVITGTKPDLLGKIATLRNDIKVPLGPLSGRTAYVIKEIKTYIETTNKNAFIIFPEGRDTEGFLDQYHYYMFDLKKGFAAIAKELNLPILPISGAFNYETFEQHLFIHNIITPKEVSHSTIEELFQQMKKSFTYGIPKALPRVKVTWISEQ
ncbi:hypothetical protein CO180_00410 [candidate division WWE3 bacterium CG_4_9_14_3_um_filter_41_6]|uniref:Phospholipid/glycerol acyltransferase domain-containing protein n=1 Tax=candidate division WWE3 bacterium CG_4_10_14_0_2_um_filter_41_14 TaxID=1975072 RepID=A0A2M7TFC0_UNCKA|nr:MAG: hypothetical protein COY32_07225 [candidate division WWE3 bacterium CG_4_10_14_0_2_um_filter_41_14]PJA39567.1 MAG: hypothetical protein CO180_00410 [candidate division WWE3 bacterium CG_4_9_14_3_um_filter_41_6]